MIICSVKFYDVRLLLALVVTHHEKRFFFVYFNLHPFQDYFSSYETGQSVGGRKQENPEKYHLAHLQAELGLSHMWPMQGSNPHQTKR